MIEYRPAAELGETHLAWLQARHHFCFAGYQDVERLEWGRTRYINHNRLAADAELQPSSHFATEMLVIVEDGEIWITRHSGRDFAIGRDRFAYIAAGTGAEFGISNRSIRPASFTTIAYRVWRTSVLSFVRRSHCPPCQIGWPVAPATMSRMSVFAPPRVSNG